MKQSKADSTNPTHKPKESKATSPLFHNKAIKMLDRVKDTLLPQPHPIFAPMIKEETYN